MSTSGAGPMTSGAITLLVIAILLVPLAGTFGAMDVRAPARLQGARRGDAARRRQAASGLEEVVAGAGPARRPAAPAPHRLRDARGGAGHRPLLRPVGQQLADGAHGRGRDGRRQLRARRRRARAPSGRQHAYGVALATAGVMRLLGRVLGPVATLLILIGNAITPGRGFRDGPFSSEVELRELVDMAEERGVVESGERNMIHSVFELGDTIAREVMVPRTDVVWIERNKTVRQALALALRSGFSRLPVIGENVDDVVGVVYLKDLVRRSQNGSDQPRPAGRGDHAAADVRPGVQAGRRAAARHAGPAHPHRDRGRRVRRLRRPGHHRGHPRGDRRRDRRRARRRPAAPGRGAAGRLDAGHRPAAGRGPRRAVRRRTARGRRRRDRRRAARPRAGPRADRGRRGRGRRAAAGRREPGGRRNRIDTLLVCRVEPPSEDADESRGSSGRGATREEEPAPVES